MHSIFVSEIYNVPTAIFYTTYFFLLERPAKTCFIVYAWHITGRIRIKRNNSRLTSSCQMIWEAERVFCFAGALPNCSSSSLYRALISPCMNSAISDSIPCALLITNQAEGNLSYRLYQEQLILNFLRIQYHCTRHKFRIYNKTAATLDDDVITLQEHSSIHFHICVCFQ